MSELTIFSLIRQAIAHATFNDSDTRACIVEGIDALEKADNDSPAGSIEDSPEVEVAMVALQEHLVELLGNPITLSSEDHTTDDDEDIGAEDEIERDTD